MLTVNAAVISAFVTPAAAQASSSIMPPGTGSDFHAHVQLAPAAPAAAHHPAMRMPPLVQLSVALNRGLAQAHVALWSLSLLLFAFAMRGRSTNLWGVGALVAAFPLAWQLSGRFSPETHTMPIIVFTQSAWLIALAVKMLGGRAVVETGDRAATGTA
jgi:hypothetical protein